MKATPRGFSIYVCVSDVNLVESASGCPLLCAFKLMDDSASGITALKCCESYVRADAVAEYVSKDSYELFVTYILVLKLLACEH